MKKSSPTQAHPTRTHHISIATALAFAGMFACVQARDAELAAGRAVVIDGWSSQPSAVMAELATSAITDAPGLSLLDDSLRGTQRGAD